MLMPVEIYANKLMTQKGDTVVKKFLRNTVRFPVSGFLMEVFSSLGGASV